MQTTTEARNDKEELTKVRITQRWREASELLPCANTDVLEAYDFDEAYWSVLDEESAERCLVLLGHRRGEPRNESWRVKRLKAIASAHGERTEDAETIARRDGEIYLFGSQFGSKEGPLDPKRAFIARFREDAIEGKLGSHAIPLEIARRPFVLHRLVNDALREAGLALIPLGPNVREAYIGQSLRLAFDKNKAWGADVRVEDWPINLEGAAFLEDGTLILGLRFPVTADGHPILLRVESIERYFDTDAAVPRATVLGVLSQTGTRAKPMGVRALSFARGTLHVVTGSIGNLLKKSSLERDYPGAYGMACEHWEMSTAFLRGSNNASSARLIHRLHDWSEVEGLACGGDGRWLYIGDSDDGILLALREGPNTSKDNDRSAM